MNAIRQTIVLMTFLTFFYSCKLEKASPQNNSDNSSGNVVNSSDPCFFGEILSNPNTPKTAIDLYHHEEIQENQYEQIFTYFDSLVTTDVQKRNFYFRAITNTLEETDGDLAEGLGYSVRMYVETNPQGFAQLFDYTECNTEEDLNLWAKYLVYELMIEEEQTGLDPGETIISNISTPLLNESQNYPESQKQTIKKLIALMNQNFEDIQKSQ